MNQRYTSIPRTLAILFALSFNLIALAQTLPVRIGKYVLESNSCTDAPNAAILSWDGKAFSGAHSSQCASHVGSRADGRYDISTACSASGDGTPATAEAKTPYNMVLKLISPTRFVISKPASGDLSYRWCSVK